MRALGIDYGRKRIGLALSDPTGLIARPWKTLAGTGGVPQAAAQLAREIEQLHGGDDGLAVVVVGLPRRLSGEPNQLTAAVQSLVERLQHLVTLPVVVQDERLSSREAEDYLARTHKDWRTRKPLVDAMAAAVILQDYLDGRSDRPAPAPADEGGAALSREVADAKEAEMLKRNGTQR